jgi:murein DD-endopeptidase MepM/ murein hydrolase activator NlpD
MTKAAAAAAKGESVDQAAANVNVNDNPSRESTSPLASPPTPAAVKTMEFWTAFARMQENNAFVWPTPKSQASCISSTLGMRIRQSDQGQDFHRGVDIHGNTGDPIVASYRGMVQRVTSFARGNRAIILEHTFESPVLFHGQPISKWYTLYLHLQEQLVAQGNVVQAGDVIGTLGDSGVLPGGGPHLHHEVRLGTPYSLEYVLMQRTKKRGNSSSSSSRGQNSKLSPRNNSVDPHVHPLYIYPRHLLGIPSITMTLQPNKNHDDGHGEVLIETTDTCPYINRFQVELLLRCNGNINKVDATTLPNPNSNNNVAAAVHVLDYNLRLGFNATTTQELDMVDTSKPYLKPIVFGYKSRRWRMKLIIPTSWVNQNRNLLRPITPAHESADILDHTAANDPQHGVVVVVTVTNIWHDAPTIFQFDWSNTTGTHVPGNVVEKTTTGA